MSTYKEKQALNRERQARYRARLREKNIPDDDRHRDGYYRERWESKRARRYFVGIDGEGVETETGQVYALIAASDGSRLYDANGLQTLDMLAWLVQLRRDQPDAIFVAYGFGYDVNMILRQLPRRCFMRLRNKGFVRYGRYMIAHTPGKHLTVSVQGKNKAVCRVYDTLGFFQQRFTDAMVDMHAIEKDSEDYRFLESMKASRGGFTASDVETLIRYNDLEVQLLVRAMETLKIAFETLELRLSSWWGAGAVATAMYQKYKVKEHLITPPHRVQMDVLSAYYGGRIEAVHAGEIGEIYAHDLNSAYPAAFVDLPSLIGGTWIRRDGSDYNRNNPFTLCFVRWSIGKNVIYPFPFRGPDRSICYPQCGSGWYWSCEVATAQKWCTTVEVTETVTCEGIDTESRPFAWIRDLYAQRQALKRAGRDAEQKCIKLGLNSLYGKCAQGVGSGKHAPPYQNYVYAGLITAITRSKLFDAAMSAKEDIIGFATDGIYAKVPLEVPIGTGLGSWEQNAYKEAFFLSAGIYTMIDSENGVRTSKGRGVPDKEIDWPLLRSVWAEKSLMTIIEYPVKHFVGYREALIRGMHLHCVWESKTKKLSGLTKKMPAISVPWSEKLTGRKCPIVRRIYTHSFYGSTPRRPKTWRFGDLMIMPCSMPYEVRRDLSEEEWGEIELEMPQNEMLKYWGQDNTTK